MRYQKRARGFHPIYKELGNLCETLMARAFCIFSNLESYIWTQLGY